MFRLSLVVVLLQAFAISLSSAFVPSAGVALQSQKVQDRWSETQLYSRFDEESSAADEIGTAPEARPPSFTVPKAAQDFFIFLSDVYSFFLIVFGSFSICGILLNFSGLGYQLTKEGLRVDTIEHMRMENQMKKEYLRMETKPPSSLPQ